MSPRPSRKARWWCIPPIPRPPRRRNWRSSARCFPKIKPTYLRLQAGALYAKLLTERQGSAYFADIAQLSDMSFALDFQKRGGYMQYVSPELAAYKPEYQSSPEGYWTWGALVMAAIAYNPNLVTRRGSAEDLAGHARSEMGRCDLGEGVDIGPAARRVVCAAPALWQRLLAAACAAQAARLRLLCPAVRPPGERPGQGRADRAIFRLPDR